MRKALVLLLALVLVGAMAYAQAPSVAINGFAETGVAFMAPSNQTNYVTQYNNDSGNTGRFRLGIAITAPDGNLGFISRLEGDSGVLGNAGNNSSAGTLGLGFNRLDGWGKMFGGLVTVKGGILDDTQFWTANRNWGGWIDGAAGLEVLLNLMPGLTVGYFLPLPGFGAGVAGQDLNPGGLLPGVTFYSGDGSLSNVLSGEAVYINYNIPNMVNIVAGFQGAHANTGGLSKDQTNSGYFWAGADVVAFPNVTARLEMQVPAIGDSTASLVQAADGVSTSAGQYNFFLEGAYTMAPLKVDVVAWISFYAAANSDMGYDIEPNVSYDLGVAKVGIVGDFGNTLTPYNPIDRAANYGVTAGPGIKDTKTNFDIGPYIGVPIGTGASVNGGVMYVNGDTSGTASNNTGVAVYVDVRYSF